MGVDKKDIKEEIQEGQIAEPCDILLTQEIYDNPEQIIEAGAIDACKKLWDLNIFTTSSQGRGNSSSITLDILDENNRKIFDDFAEKYPKNYRWFADMKSDSERPFIYGDGGYLSPDLIEGFVMQDVPSSAYEYEENFLILKANYVTYELSPQGDGSVIAMFDESKLTDTIENTVIDVMKEKGIPLELYVPEEHRIYENDYCLNAHKKYLKALQKGEIVQSSEFNV